MKLLSIVYVDDSVMFTRKKRNQAQ